MRTIAITGGIGSGKTAVTDYLEEKLEERLKKNE